MTEETLQIIVKELLNQREILIKAMADAQMFMADRQQLSHEISVIDAKLQPYFEATNIKV